MKWRVVDMPDKYGNYCVLVKKDTYDRLVSLKVHRRESFDECLRRVLAVSKSVEQEACGNDCACTQIPENANFIASLSEQKIPPTS